MRVSRKTGLRIPRKTITLRGNRNENIYCVINGVSYNGGAEEMKLSLPVGTVITLYGHGTSILIGAEKSVKLEVNGWPIFKGTKSEYALRYVVTVDATIQFGYDTSYDYSIGVVEKEEKTIRFYTDAGGSGAYFPEEVYIAKRGMTWENWCDNKKYQENHGTTAGSMSTKGFAAGVLGVSFCDGASSLPKPVYTADGARVTKDDEILDGHTYVVASE